MAVRTIRVRGLAELIRATDAAGGDTKKYVRDELRKAAEPIRREAAARFASTDARTASRYGVSVRRTGTITVEQRLRKSSDVSRRRRNFGGLQMRRALLPALHNNQERVYGAVEDALERVCQRWGAGG